MVAKMFALAVALALALGAVGWLAAGFYMWLATRLPGFAAALILAGTLLVGAAIVLWLALAPSGAEAGAAPSGRAGNAPDDVERVLRMAENLVPAIRRKPVRSILLALAVGIGVGLFFDRTDGEDER